MTKDVLRAYVDARSDAPYIATLNSTVTNTTLTDMQFAHGPAAKIPLWLVAVYVAANVVLNSLNYYWFAKMITAIRKRFRGERREKKEEGGVLMEELESDEVGTDREKITAARVNGVQVVEVEKTEVRKRKSGN